MNLTAPRIFCVGTHHKTGTLWMRTVFRKLAAALDVPHRVTFPNAGLNHVPERGRIFLFQWSSKFPPAVLARPDARIVHVIRDPRDVLLSGARYHLHAPEGGEEFLHAPREDLGGRTYQEHLAGLGGEAERLLFEMRGKHAETVAEMRAWTPAANTLELRYEDLIADVETVRFREALRDLGLPEAEVETGRRLFWENALFGGLADREARGARVDLHVASGRAAQWRTRLPRDVAAVYAREHGADLVALGYEAHPTAWLENLSDAA